MNVNLNNRCTECDESFYDDDTKPLCLDHYIHWNNRVGAGVCYSCEEDK